MTKTSARIKALAPDFPVPQSAIEADSFIVELGRRQRDRAIIEVQMNESLALIKHQCEAEAKPHSDRISALLKGLSVWAEANRDALTRQGKVKFHRFAAGEISWRTRPPKVGVRGMEVVIAAVKRLGLVRFLRIKEELNKEAMLAEADLARTIAGVTIASSGEDFVVKPFETELEEIA